MKNIKKVFFGVPAVFLAATMLAGCATTLREAIFPPSENPTRYFVLASAIQETPDDAKLPRVIFTRIDIPAYLDVPQIVMRDGNEISKNEKRRWGEPLSRAVSRELSLRCAANLAARGVSGKQPMVSVSFDRFDGCLSENVEIAATYAVFRATKSGVPADGLPASKVFKAKIPVEAPNDYDAYIVALNSALDALAQAIADSAVEFSANGK